MVIKLQRSLLIIAISVVPLISGCFLFRPGSVEQGRSGRKFHGKASYYADELVGRKMANGERYRASRLTAAHRTLPFGTLVRVTNRQNGKQVKVEITDRGPFVPLRVIDLSRAAAERLNMIGAGTVMVDVEVIG